MNVIMLQKHEYPAHRERDVRGESVLDSGDHILGYVANLFVDEDERRVRFLDVVPQNWLGMQKKRHHHLIPIEALISREEAIRRDSFEDVELQVDKETVESSPTLPLSLDAADFSELQEAVRQHFEAALR
jgi:2-keto-4-pentenoate hydratase/2-oxohepta-3-ene-1,7-dioic acid hydratase in catechol pathway